MNDEYSPVESGKLLQSSSSEDELRELYNQMVRVAYSKLYNKSDALDVVQEAWVRMLANHHTLREHSKLSAWAKSITVNVALNLNKESKRWQRCSTCETDEACRHSLLPAKTEAELMIEISELLGVLDAKSRTMLLYKFYYGFKDQEIADAMKEPVGTIKARIHRTKIQLKRWMSGSGSLPG
ncbi:RNA polymerase sigma factor [Paenibacillus solisilvae]|uniref:RNA polymerase sigma factor n=1 Tax=Paenibacillus solisilvae TaxID=2486751 RepID=A0ABW0W6M7_9BACL